MVTKFNLFIILNLISSLSFGIDCKKQSKIDIYRKSNLVFTGTIVEVSSNHFSVLVGEKFKGKYKKDTLIAVIQNNSIIPEKGEDWLIYAEDLGELIYVDDCLGSKSFNWPYGIQDISSPEQPPPFFRDESMVYLLENIWKDRALNELYFEILSLRQFKIQNENTMMDEGLSSLENYKLALEKEIHYIKWMIAFVIFLLIIFIITSLTYKNK
jgi:hypothetical protein